MPPRPAPAPCSVSRRAWRACLGCHALDERHVGAGQGARWQQIEAHVHLHSSQIQVWRQVNCVNGIIQGAFHCHSDTAAAASSSLTQFSLLEELLQEAVTPTAAESASRPSQRPGQLPGRTADQAAEAAVRQQRRQQRGLLGVRPLQVVQHRVHVGVHIQHVPIPAKRPARPQLAPWEICGAQTKFTATDLHDASTTVL